MRTLLFGGTFDPPHNGHMNNLRAALELVQPGRAIVMPAGIPPHKHASATAGELRLQMCACFTALSPVVEVSRWEIDRAGSSYTIHTLEMLHETCPEDTLYMSVGSDMLRSFTKWYHWQDILALATLVVQSREKDDEAALRKCAAALEYCHGRVLFARAEALPVASSDIRAGRIPRSRLAEFIPPAAMEVITANGLY